MPLAGGRHWEVPPCSVPPDPAELFRLLVGAGDLGRGQGGGQGKELVALEPQS